MYLDNLAEFADATAVGTPNNSTVNVGDVIDTGAVARDLGVPDRLYLVIQVTTAFTSGGSAVVRFKLVSDAVEPPETDGTATEHFTSNDFAVAALTAGNNVVIVSLPLEGPAYERYLGVQVQETAGQALTAGAINAFLTPDPRAYKAYPDASN
jgi:hypothetical protein